MQAYSCDNLNKGYCKLSQVKGTTVVERGPTAPPDTRSTRYTREVAQHVIKVWIGPGTGDLLESTVAQGFVKHGFKVLLHRVVDGPLQASRCLD